MYKCVFFGTSAFFYLPAAGLFSCPRLRDTQGARLNTTAQVRALAEVRGTCSGGSKWQVPTERGSEHVEPSRLMQTHVQVKKNVRRLMYRSKECPTAYVISWILNVVNIVRHYFVMERLKECPTAHIQVKRMSDGSCDTVLSRIAVRVWYNVHWVMNDHLSPLLILLLIILRPTNTNKVAYISIATYFVFVHSLSSTAVRFCSPQ